MMGDRRKLFPVKGGPGSMLPTKFGNEEVGGKFGKGFCRVAVALAPPFSETFNPNGGLEPGRSHSPRSWCGWRRCHILLEEPGSSKKGAATRSLRGVLDELEWDDSTALNSHVEIRWGHNRESYRAGRIPTRLDLRTLPLAVQRRTEGRNWIRDLRLRSV